MYTEKTQNSDFVLSYLQKIGLRICRTESKFWNLLYKSYDRKLIEEIKKTLEERGKMSIPVKGYTI